MIYLGTVAQVYFPLSHVLSQLAASFKNLLSHLELDVDFGPECTRACRGHSPPSPPMLVMEEVSSAYHPSFRGVQGANFVFRDPGRPLLRLWSPLG
jgi:hypothetical protein